MLVNKKRQEYENKKHGFLLDFRELARTHDLTTFDLEVICSEVLYTQIHDKIKNKV